MPGRLLLLALLALMVPACVSHRAPAWTELAVPVGSLGDAAVDGLVADGDRDFDARENPEKLDEAMAAYRTALRYRPEDAALLVRAARAALSQGAITPGDKGEAELDAAVGFAERALALRNPLLRAKLARKQPAAWVFDAADPADLPALIAYAEALFAWADRAGTGTLLEEQDRIHYAATRALGIDRRASHAAPDRLLAALFSSLPSGAGANLVLSVDHFEAALAGAPGFLQTKVDYAERYASRVRDGKLFRRLLKEVLLADPRALADAVAENLAAQRDARRLLGGY